MKPISLSLCMIVRDSSRTLPEALDSIQPWVDEMIIVDTGSVDETPQIAKQFGARVYHFPWRDHFAAARNESLRHASGNWLFWMDSDDTIDEANGRKLRELANGHDPAPMAYVMQVHCPGPGTDGSVDVTVVDHVKLFRNLPELRFEGRIHEQVLPAIRRLGGEVAWSDVFVVHSGSDQSVEGRRKKQARDLRLIELELQDHPNHPFALFNLGMTYADMEQHADAVLALQRSLDVSGPGESHVRKAYALLICSLTQLDRLTEAQRFCEQGLRLFPEDPELQFRRGLLTHRRGRLSDAVEAYRAALADDHERCFSSRDQGITGYKARHNLAIVYEEQGRHDLAELQWREVLAAMPDYRPGWRGLTESLLVQNRLVTLEVEAEMMANRVGLECEAALARSELARIRGDIAAAILEIEQAMKEFPEDVELLRKRCRLLFEHGRLEHAEAALVDFCRREPSDGAALHNLGAIYVRSERFLEAVEMFERSLAVRPRAPQTQEQLASVRQRLEHEARTS